MSAASTPPRQADSRVASYERRSSRRLTWAVFGVLLLGALVGALGVLPYSLALTPSRPVPGAPPLPVLLALSIVQSLVLASAAAAVGLWLGPGLGLGAPLLRAWLGGDPTARRRMLASAPLAAALGVLGSLIVLVLEAAVFVPRLDAQQPGVPAPAPWLGALAALYGGINEEILLRLGLMTVLVWLGTRLAGGRAPGPAVMWSANVLAAGLFGLGHLPATALLMPLTPLVVARVLTLNGLLGVVFGWLYWRRGLVAAMMAHVCADLVLHVVVPLALPGA